MQLTPNARRLDRNAQRRRAPDSDNPRCRAEQRDRVLTGVKARRCATPPLRGAAALTPAPRTVTGNLARQPENHLFKGRRNSPIDALNEPRAGSSRYADGFDSRDGSRHRGALFSWPQASLCTCHFQPGRGVPAVHDDSPDAADGRDLGRRGGPEPPSRGCSRRRPRNIRRCGGGTGRISSARSSNRLGGTEYAQEGRLHAITSPTGGEKNREKRDS